MNKENLVFLDTETTGIDGNDRLCQVAYKFGGQEFEALFKPPVPMSVEAMSVSHITNKMVEGKEPFLESEMKRELENIFSSGNILVAHNAKFDAEILKRENLEIEKIIDTLKIAQHLDSDAEIPRYNLQYLRYYFGLEVENAIAHNALGDIRVLEKIFDHFFNQMQAAIGDEKKVLQEMLEISARPILFKKFNFGKYNGLLIEQVASENPSYLKWLLDEKIRARENGEGNDENWIFTLENYLK